MFEIGQLVVCVNDKGFVLPAASVPPRKGHVYEVVGFSSYFVGGVSKNGGVLLDSALGVLNGRAIGWNPSRFRPVTKRNEEIIAGLLVPKKDEVDA